MGALDWGNEMKQRMYLFTAAFLIVMMVMGAAQFGAWWGSLFFKDAFAQVTPPAITSGDIKRGIFTVTWTEGQDPASEVRVKCRPDGTAAGAYTFVRILPPVKVQTIPMVDLLPKSGLYYCVVVGAAAIPGVTTNISGVAMPVLIEGVASSEVPFAAGVAPSGTGKGSASFS